MGVSTSETDGRHLEPQSSPSYVYAVLLTLLSARLPPPTPGLKTSLEEFTIPYS